MALITAKKAELSALCPDVVLGEQLGEGGNARVFAGTHTQHGAVAVKFLLNENKKRYARFRDEVLVVTNRLNGSPRVVPIFAFDLPEVTAGTVPWYVMPRAEGLNNSLKGRGWRERLLALIELAEGLVELHSSEVAHRDIKPENLFMLGSTYRFGDFGIAAFPERSGVTSSNEPMGPWAYLAPEMLSDATSADAYKADVYSFAKTVWAVFTEEKVPFGGQYNPNGIEALSSRTEAAGFITEPLDSLLKDSTDSFPLSRPSADEFAARLREVALLQGDRRRANPIQWEAAELDALRHPGLVRAVWEEPASIAAVLTLLSRRQGLNHCFYPEGGGMVVERASLCEGDGMLMLHIQYGTNVVVKPARLTLERFANRPDISYAVLETLEVQPLGVAQRYRDGKSEYLNQLNEFDYVPDDSDDDEPQHQGAGTPCERRFKAGIYVVAPTGGIYNLVDDYMGTAQKLGREGLRRRFQAFFESQSSETSANPTRLVPVVRLLKSAENARVPFTLQYVSREDLTSLLDVEGTIVAVRKREFDARPVSLGHKSMLDALLAGPSKEEVAALSLLQNMSPEKLAELMSLLNIGRNLVDPSELPENTTQNLRAGFDARDIVRKLGNSFLRRAISRFGLEVLANAAVEGPEDSE